MRKISKKYVIFISVIFLFLLVVFSIVLITNNKNKSEIKVEKIGCKKTGCSGQLCLESTNENVVTTCEWREEYSCYQKAKCERQKDGKCGITKDDQFNKCIDTLTPKYNYESN